MSMRRSLRKLIVGGEFFSNPKYTNYTTTISRRIKGSYTFPGIFNSFNSLHFSGYTKCKHYHVEAETRGGSQFEGKEVHKRSITKGDIISLNDHLFTKNRDYLIKNNNEHVKAEQLEGKVIVLYFVKLYSGSPLYSKWHTELLKDIYDDLHPVNNFEVVLVAYDDVNPDFLEEIPVHLQSDSQKHFENLFSYMPWTAIPFSDLTSRKHMHRRFGMLAGYCMPVMFIVDQTGMVLQCYNCWDIFEYYGALGYPFSDKRLKFLRTEDYLASQQPSLKTLLGSPQRDYVISSNGDKVPIHTFEDKVVALYFYHPDYPDSLTEELKLAYEEFAKIKKIFEVVLVYIREPRLGYPKYDFKSKESFWEVFKTMPWLALPFKDMSNKTLMRVFELASYDVESDINDVLVPRLVIFGPHADYIEPFGCSMLSKYGIRAFPFTRKKAVELEIEKVKELKLWMLWNPNTVFKRNDGSQVPFSQLSGKRVMLVLESSVFDDGSKKAEFLTMLKERYLQKKGTDGEFEVIRILINDTESSVSKHLVSDMPWLVSPASKLVHDLGSSYFWYNMSAYCLLNSCLPIFAFNLDGRLVRKTLDPKFEDVEFPFYAGGLEEETLSQLITWSWGDYSQFFQYNGRIYT